MELMWSDKETEWRRREHLLSIKGEPLWWCVSFSGGLGQTTDKRQEFNVPTTGTGSTVGERNAASMDTVDITLGCVSSEL